jgi:hypothetical protein
MRRHVADEPGHPTDHSKPKIEFLGHESFLTRKERAGRDSEDRSGAAWPSVFAWAIRNVKVCSSSDTRLNLSYGCLSHDLYRKIRDREREAEYSDLMQSDNGQF